jgi:hypothetical protein
VKIPTYPKIFVGNLFIFVSPWQPPQSAGEQAEDKKGDDKKQIIFIK